MEKKLLSIFSLLTVWSVQSGSGSAGMHHDGTFEGPVFSQQTCEAQSIIISI